jgi:hypothetical protein
MLGVLSADGRYGLGRKRRMAFKDFLSRAAEGDETLYLTTQKVGRGR